MRQKRPQHRFIFFTVFTLLGILTVWFSQNACQRLEFEPENKPFIITDSITPQDEETFHLYASILYIGPEAITDHGFCWSDTGTATIEGATVHFGARESTGPFSAEISGLNRRSRYYVRAFVVTGSGTTYSKETYFQTPPRSVDPVLTDVDGNTYNVVIIGNQAWMKENLRTTHYADGAPIPLVENDTAWDALSPDEKAYSWYDNDPSKSYYGAYYTWAAAMNGEAGSASNPSGVQGVCPDEWHIPSDSEWNQMHIYLGMSFEDADRIGSLGSRQRVGTRMKGVGNPLWDENLSDWWVNESGFTALPVGMRTSSGNFQNVTVNTYYWSATPFDENNILYRYLQRGNRAVLRVYGQGDIGYSVRCVIDL